MQLDEMIEEYIKTNLKISISIDGNNHITVSLLLNGKEISKDTDYVCTKD